MFWFIDAFVVKKKKEKSRGNESLLQELVTVCVFNSEYWWAHFTSPVNHHHCLPAHTQNNDSEKTNESILMIWASHRHKRGVSTLSRLPESCDCLFSHEKLTYRCHKLNGKASLSVLLRCFFLNPPHLLTKTVSVCFFFLQVFPFYLSSVDQLALFFTPQS